MKLQLYLNEASMKITDMDEIVSIIKKDCQPFLNEFTNIQGNPVYRGTNKNMKDTNIIKVRSRTKRKPKDIPPHLHELLDKLFLKHHGWKARSEGVFVTHHRGSASDYGWPALFFPKGKYQYLWNGDVEDLYPSLRTKVAYHVPEIGNITAMNLTPEQIAIPKFVNLLDMLVSDYNKTDFSRAIGTRHEAMFKCHDYYMVSFDNQKDDIEFLTRLK